VNAAPVLASFSPLRRRSIVASNANNDNHNGPPLMIRGSSISGHHHHHHRQTQQEDDGTGTDSSSNSAAPQLNVNFIDCRFENNRQRSPPALFTYGVITVSTLYHNLNVRNCQFVGNDYSTSEVRNR
jgi:hypothetical protein